jgi:hypothetical protein
VRKSWRTAGEQNLDIRLVVDDENERIQ